MILLLVLGTTIPLSMKKKVKISMTNPLQQGKQQPQQKTLKKSAFFDDHRWYRGKPPKISNDEGDPANRFQSRNHHPPLHAKKSRKIHGYLPQQQPHIETLKKYIFSNDHQWKGWKFSFISKVIRLIQRSFIPDPFILHSMERTVKKTKTKTKNSNELKLLDC